MQPTWEILQAMLHCHYKAWQLAKKDDGTVVLSTITDNYFNVPSISLSSIDKLILTALCYGRSGNLQDRQQEIDESHIALLMSI